VLPTSNPLPSVPPIPETPIKTLDQEKLPPLKISPDNPFIRNTEITETPIPSVSSDSSVTSVLPSSNPIVTPTTSDNLDYATPLRRFFSAVLDGFVLTLFLTLLSFPFIYFFQLDKVLAQMKPEDVQVLLEPYSVFISSGLYLFISCISALFISLWGGTPGKIILRLKVLTIEGGKVSFGRALLREMVGKWISSLAFDIGYLWALWDSKHQTWHDKIANTVVVKV